MRWWLFVILGCASNPPPSHRPTFEPASAKSAAVSPGTVLELAITDRVATIKAARPCKPNEPYEPKNVHRRAGSSGVGVIPELLIQSAVDARAAENKKPPPPPPKEEPGGLTMVCAVPVSQLAVELELPSGVVVELITDAHGNATFAIPKNAPDGPFVARAGAISTPAMRATVSAPN